MGDKDYENHVFHKYRLAVALAVIRNKPENQSLDQYVEFIKSKLTNTFPDSEKDDLSSVNSEDFDIEMSNNVNTNYKPENQTLEIDLENTDPCRTETQLQTNEKLKENLGSELNKGARDNNLDAKSMVNNTSEDNTVNIIAPQDSLIENLNESLNILQDYNMSIEDNVDMERSQVLTDVLSILQSVDKEIDDLRHNMKPVEIVPQNDSRSSDKLMESENATQDLDSQATIPYTYTNTEYNTHISQSQAENIVIGKQYIVSKIRQNENDEINKDSLHIVTNDKSAAVKDNGPLTNDDNFKDNAYVNDNLDNNDICGDENNYTEDLIGGDQDPTGLQESSQAEGIPFKIIEEMSKVKTLLNRKGRKMSTEGYSTDSGYRSESLKSFRNSLHISDNWLNQSGCSLLRHIAQCSLTISTNEINDEIAQVLGILIDRLQEEEKCPTFLEEILENVDTLLKSIHEGSSGTETALTDKDENIHRLLLFNKSIHIQKYTISKITTVLERKHQKFTSTDTIHELENIDQVENLCYIFHVLEILLLKYVKNKNHSQSSQSSQNEERFPKRSTITDIWRKKWNTASKETFQSEGSYEKVCVLTKCREVLNKLIVDCMHGYSLVAFSALQCFNLLQMGLYGYEGISTANLTLSPSELTLKQALIDQTCST